MGFTTPATETWWESGPLEIPQFPHIEQDPEENEPSPSPEPVPEEDPELVPV